METSQNHRAVVFFFAPAPSYNPSSFGGGNFTETQEMWIKVPFLLGARRTVGKISENNAAAAWRGRRRGPEPCGGAGSRVRGSAPHSCPSLSPMAPRPTSAGTLVIFKISNAISK